MTASGTKCSTSAHLSSCQIWATWLLTRDNPTSSSQRISDSPCSGRVSWSRLKFEAKVAPVSDKPQVPDPVRKASGLQIASGLFCLRTNKVFFTQSYEHDKASAHSHMQSSLLPLLYYIEIECRPRPCLGHCDSLLFEPAHAKQVPVFTKTWMKSTSLETKVGRLDAESWSEPQAWASVIWKPWNASTKHHSTNIERTGHWKKCVNISGLFLHLHAISSGDHPREWLAQSFVQAVRTCRCTVSFTKSLVAASRHVSNSKTTKRDNRGYQSVRKISLVLMQCHWVAANEAHQLAVASFLLWDPAFHCSDDKTHTCRDVCMILHVFKPHADLQIGLS